jgi:uncharacterized protein (DUF3820 family)
VDEGTILANKCAREDAETIFQLCEEQQTVRFWEVLAGLVATKLPAPRTVPVMTELEAYKFGQREVPFGEFRGRRVDEVPLERLLWYADQRFVDELRRYLHSSRIRAELGQAGLLYADPD